MSYNLTSHVLNVKKIEKLSELIDDSKHYMIFMHDIYTVEPLFEMDEKLRAKVDFVNLFQCDNSFDSQLKAKAFHESLLNIFSDKTSDLEIEIKDFYSDLCKKVEDPEKYELIQQEDDFAIYVLKSFMSQHKDTAWNAIESLSYDPNGVIYCYHKEWFKRKVKCIIFENIESQYIAHLFNRETYQELLPAPLSDDWWGVHAILKRNDFQLLKGSKELKNTNSSLSSLDFVEGENMIFIER